MTSEMVEDDIDIWSHYLRHEQNGNLKKAVKLSVYTVPEVWYKARKIIAQLDGGTFLESEGVWLDSRENKIHYDQEAGVIIYISESVEKVELVRSIIRIMAELCDEKAVIEAVEPILMCESKAKGNIAKLSTNDSRHKKIITAISASIYNLHSSEFLSELGHLRRTAVGDERKVIEEWEQINALSDELMKQIRD